jgi:hypothetical protein
VRGGKALRKGWGRGLQKGWARDGEGQGSRMQDRGNENCNSPEVKENEIGVNGDSKERLLALICD